MKPHSQELPKSRLCLFNPRSPAAGDVERLNEVYHFWHGIWDHTFKELGGRGLRGSDDFHRQDEIAVIYSEDQILGAIAFSFFDLKIASHRQHSYFQAYPAEILAQIEEQGLHRLMSIGFLSVDPQWRKSRADAFVSESLVGVACQRFLESNAQLAIASTRNDRKMNDLAYRHGAQCLKAGQSQHNVEVDFVCFRRDGVLQTSVPGIPEFIAGLWRNREDTVHFPATEIPRAA